MRNLLIVTLAILAAVTANASNRPKAKAIQAKAGTHVVATYDTENLPALIESCPNMDEGDVMTECLNNAQKELDQDNQMYNEGEES